MTGLPPRSRLLEWLERRRGLARTGPLRKFWHRLHRLAGGESADRSVEWHDDVYSCTLLLPANHPLPRYRAEHPLYDTALIRLAQFLSEGDPLLVALDIGANVGDTTAALLSVAGMRVIAVEGNPAFLPYLRRNLVHEAERVRVIECFVSAGANRALGLETANGTARLTRDTHSVQTALRFAPLPEIATVPGWPLPSLVKVDTDGFDIVILTAARQWLAENQPVLFFEFDPALAAPHSPDPWTVFTMLAGIGYVSGLAYANTGELLGRVAPGGTEALRDWLAQPGVAYLDIAMFTDPALSAAFVVREGLA